MHRAKASAPVPCADGALGLPDAGAPVAVGLNLATLGPDACPEHAANSVVKTATPTPTPSRPTAVAPKDASLDLFMRLLLRVEV